MSDVFGAVMIGSGFELDDSSYAIKFAASANHNA